MDKYAKLKELLRGICGYQESNQPLLFQAEVLKIQGDCCEINIGGLHLSDVRLKAVADGQTEGVMLIIPAVGSRVLVGSLTGDYRDLAVLNIERFEKLLLGGDEFGGMVKVPELVKKLNLLEKEINDFRTVVGGWVPATGDGGGALKTTLANWLSGHLTETQQEEIENTKIVHG